MSDWLSWFLAGVLALWFAATALTNIRGLERWRRWDWLGVIPRWTLFVMPRIYDVALVRRDVLPDGSLTRWHEERVVVPRPWYSFIWHPAMGPKRALVALADQIDRTSASFRGGLAPTSSQGSPGAVEAMTTSSYLMLLKYVTARSHPIAVATQFMVLALRDQAITGPYDQSAGGRVLFVSEFHGIDRPAVLPAQRRT